VRAIAGAQRFVPRCGRSFRRSSRLPRQPRKSPRGRDVRWAYNAARTGRIFVDGPSGDVLQFEEEATGFPAGFSFIQRNQVMNWDFVKIGDISHWLPVSADFSWRMGDGSLTRAAAVYKNHRHFEATTNVTFQ